MFTTEYTEVTESDYLISRLFVVEEEFGLQGTQIWVNAAHVEVERIWSAEVAEGRRFWGMLGGSRKREFVVLAWRLIERIGVKRGLTAKGAKKGGGSGGVVRWRGERDIADPIIRAA